MVSSRPQATYTVLTLAPILCGTTLWWLKLNSASVKFLCVSVCVLCTTGVQFIWDSCCESVKTANSSQGSGCILAHCMGLGKTLQVHTGSSAFFYSSENIQKVSITLYKCLYYKTLHSVGYCLGFSQSCSTFTGRYFPPHGAAVKEPEVQHCSGRVSSQYCSQLDQRVQ